MLAIVAGFFLVAYLLGPGAIYRVIFGIFTPSKRLQRSRTEEVVFSVFATVLPFALTWLVLFHTPIGHWPRFAGAVPKDAAYSRVGASLLDFSFKGDPTMAYWRALREQVRFVIYLWAFCIGEAALAVLAVRRYGDIADTKFGWICEKLFLVHVSEWQWLFSTDFLPSKQRNKAVHVDVLTSGDMLYRGKVTDWFTDNDGKLVGLFLSDADRYRRDKLSRDRENQIVEPPDSYWKPIPGSLLYIPSTSIINYNVRHVDLGTSAPSDS